MLYGEAQAEISGCSAHGGRYWEVVLDIKKVYDPCLPRSIFWQRLLWWNGCEGCFWLITFVIFLILYFVLLIVCCSLWPFTSNLRQSRGAKVSGTVTPHAPREQNSVAGLQADWCGDQAGCFRQISYGGRWNAATRCDLRIFTDCRKALTVVAWDCALEAPEWHQVLPVRCWQRVAMPKETKHTSICSSEG